MKRRTFLMTGGTMLLALNSAGQSETSPGANPFVLSTEGCGRATGYAEANKIVTWDGKTHVAYLDSPPEGFRVRIRTLDHQTNTWSPPYTVDEAFDNHGGPALAIDSQGYLHMAYYPHHHPMRIKKSLRPNDASAWSAAEEVGERVTYPTLVIDNEDTLYLTCRQNRSEPWRVNLYTKKAGDTWSDPRPILSAEETGYAHFMDALAWSPDKKHLHLVTRIHDGTPPRSHTVGYMRSADQGATWTRHDGTPIALPATAATIEVIEQVREGAGAGLRAAGLSILPDGRPVALYSSQDVVPNDAWLAMPDGDGGWEKHSLRPALPEPYTDWNLFTPGGITVSKNGTLFVVLTLIPPGKKPEHSGWGTPGCEVIGFTSTDGGQNFTGKLLSKIDPAVPHWLPNVERNTGHNTVPDTPGVIYTAGVPGEGNDDLLSNEVHWVRF